MGETPPSANGLPADVAAELYPLLRSLSRRAWKRAAIGTQTTSVVHEAWIRLHPRLPGVRDKGRFAAMAAATVRSVLVDAARRESREKRGGRWMRVPLAHAEMASVPELDALPGDVDVVELDAALSELEGLSARRARVVELRFFGGLSVAQCAEELGIGERTVESEWHLARAWLRAALERRVETRA